MSAHNLLSQKGTIPLLVLLSKGEQRFTELHDGLQISRYTLTTRLNETQEVGWVAVDTATDGGDQRHRFYRLLPSGRAVVEELDNLDIVDIAERRRKAQLEYERQLDEVSDNLPEPSEIREHA